MLETTTREPTTVGEVLQEEYLTPLGIGQEELAKVLGVTRATVNRLCNGHRRMSVAEANLFADLFETTADFWLNLQAAHDRWEARQADAQRVDILLGRGLGWGQVHGLSRAG